MISKDLETTLQRAINLAKECKHPNTTLEHLLLSLLETTDVATFFQKIKVPLDFVQDALWIYLREELPILSEAGENCGRVTMDFQRVLQRATLEARARGAEMTPLDLLASLCGEEGAFACRVLMDYNVFRDDVLRARKVFVEKKGAPPADPIINAANNVQKEEKKESLLAQYCTQMTGQGAAATPFPPLLGREDEVHRMVEVLCRQTKNNPLLVGEPGVGKTALVEGLAHRIDQGEVPEPLLNHDIFALDMGGLLAGTRFRGDFEERLKGILTECQARPNPTILFIDEVHTIIGTGAVQGGSLDTANLLKPALSRGRIRCIAATTFTEYRTQLQKDTALLRRFQKIDVLEPTRDDCVQILEGLKARFEKHHDLHYTKEAIESAVDLSMRYLTDRFLPDKAIDVLDETGAHLRLNQKTKRRAASVQACHIADTIGRLAGIPSQQVSSDDRQVLSQLEKSLKRVVFGQDKAVESVVSAVKLARSGLRHAEKPMGCFLFSGPTGVGKTEIARQLSKVLAMPLVRFDMSEYMEKHSVAKLIGSPPGYVGYEKGGLLTEAITKNPYAILLLDEIEKAHPDIYNVLLQVMDYGMLTDPQGRSISFRQTMVILTTNAGAQDLEKNTMGFHPSVIEGGDDQALKRVFTPEFRNRLDATVSFNALRGADLLRIVDKFLLEFDLVLREKNIHLKIDRLAKEWLAKRGYDPVYGARPLARLVEESLKKPLADEVLFGKLTKGGRVTAKVKKNALELVCER
jgi:ATP-dependent Clp protease ATP-binding subunit ClpA